MKLLSLLHSSSQQNLPSSYNASSCIRLKNKSHPHSKPITKRKNPQNNLAPISKGKSSSSYKKRVPRYFTKDVVHNTKGNSFKKMFEKTPSQEQQALKHSFAQTAVSLKGKNEIQGQIQSEILEGLKAEELYYVPKRIKSNSYSTEINRILVTGWIKSACDTFGYRGDTIFLALNILDRSLGEMHIQRNDFLSSLGVVSLHLAAKYEEKKVPPLFSFIKLFPEACQISEEQIIDLENRVVVLLGFRFGYSSPLLFLERIQMIQCFEENQRKEIENRLLEYVAGPSDFRYWLPSELARLAFQQFKKKGAELQDQSKGQFCSNSESFNDSDYFYA